MSWYWIISAAGEKLYKVFVTNLDDLADNVPQGCTVRPSASQVADD